MDKSLGCLSTILTTLDFSTIKNELFPVVAAVFSKTSSLGIKIRGLEAFVILCGGSPSENSEPGDGLDGAANDQKHQKQKSSAILDKYTVQEKVVPLLKAMKTKEPAVMMAALAVFKQVGKIADSEFLAMDVLPVLWAFSLGPLLNLQQFQEFMKLIKSLSSKIEQEQTRKLRDLDSNSNTTSDNPRSNDLMSMGPSNGLASNGGDDLGENDFERLVLGRKPTTAANGTDMLGSAQRPQPQRAQSAASTPAPVFNWSTTTPTPTQPPAFSNTAVFSSTQPSSRAITPDQTLSSFAALKPVPMANGPSAFAPMQPLQPTNNATNNWSFNQTPAPISPFPLPTPPTPQAPFSTFSTFSIAPPPSVPQRSMAQAQQGQYGGGLGRGTSGGGQGAGAGGGQQKKGLDAFESLL